MKKILAFLLILSLVFFAGFGCKKNDPNGQEPIDPDPKQEEPINSEKNDPGDKTDDENYEQEEGKSKIHLFPEAAEGRFTDSQIKFGTSREKVYSLMGEPEEIMPWQGADLYVFGNFGVYMDPDIEEVIGLTAGQGYKTYGVEIGMTEDEIRSILGQPDSAGDITESGFYGIDYDAGDYVIAFEFQGPGEESIGVTIYNYFNYKGE